MRQIREVVSFFDGMSCGQQALKELGVKFDKYHAIKITMKNHPETIQHGDVTQWYKQKINWSRVDLILAGSPCQGFSFIGKQLAFNDPRSALFFVWSNFVRFMRLVRGDNYVFLLENTRMRKEFLNVISDKLSVEPVFIDSALVCPQMRQRYYWSNRKVTIPGDQHIYLDSVIEEGVGVIKNHGEWKLKNDKSTCLDANYHKGVDNHGQRTMVQIKEGQHRKFTPIECERLQGLPDNYTEGVSNTQRYKMLGNGWQIDTIKHILADILA